MHIHSIISMPNLIIERMRMSSTLIFDLGRTLVDFDHAGWGDMYLTHREPILKLARACERGEISAEAFRASMGKILPSPPADFDTWWCSIFAAEPLVEASWLRTLSQRHRMGLLSNTDPIHFSYIRRQYEELLAPFDFFITSFATGAAKPAAAIYEAAERQAECPPERILYFDDIPEFIAAARERGWQAELFQGQAAAEAAIARWEARTRATVS